MLAVAERVATKKLLNTCKRERKFTEEADNPNIEKKRRCSWPMKNRGTTLLRHMLKFLERILDGRIRAVV